MTLNPNDCESTVNPHYPENPTWTDMVTLLNVLGGKDTLTVSSGVKSEMAILSVQNKEIALSLDNTAFQLSQDGNPLGSGSVISNAGGVVNIS